MGRKSRDRRRKRQRQADSRTAAGAPAAPGGGRGGRRLSRAKLRRRIQWAAAGLVVAALVGGLWWHSSARQQDFQALAEQGREALEARVVSERSAGRGHESGGVSYDERFPTSGPHHPSWVDPGVYSEPQPVDELVHALEHGNIVIYYDEPGDAVMGQLREWASLYDDQWSGIVVTPARRLGESIMLTAWTRRLRLEEFEPAMAAAFIDAYRGRGPEHPVR